jgi:hypothetical protein
MSLRVTFDSNNRDFILDAFGKTTANGYIVEKPSNGGDKVLTPRGEEIQIGEFAGVRKGSVIFVKSDTVSLIEAAEAIGE